MKAMRNDNSVAEIGDSFLDSMNRKWIYFGISDVPQDHSPTGGRFAGRVTVADVNGNKDYLYPFEIGLHIEMNR